MKRVFICSRYAGDISDGMRWEIAHAHSLGKPVVELTEV